MILVRVPVPAPVPEAQAEGGPPGVPARAAGHPRAMTLHFAASVHLAERWDGPPWFKWAFLGVWALCGVFVLYKLSRNGWKFPRRR